MHPVLAVRRTLPHERALAGRLVGGLERFDRPDPGRKLRRERVSTDRPPLRERSWYLAMFHPGKSFKRSEVYTSAIRHPEVTRRAAAP